MLSRGLGLRSMRRVACLMLLEMARARLIAEVVGDGVLRAAREGCDAARPDARHSRGRREAVVATTIRLDTEGSEPSARRQRLSLRETETRMRKNTAVC